MLVQVQSTALKEALAKKELSEGFFLFWFPMENSEIWSDTSCDTNTMEVPHITALPQTDEHSHCSEYQQQRQNCIDNSSRSLCFEQP